MSDWTAGYVSEIGYAYGYYTELNPLRAPLAFLHAGLRPPELGTHCELGFGQGLSINIHGAASAHASYGTDFLPGQAGFAIDMAKGSGADLHLYDEAFSEFCHRQDLPDFDSIGLHGIWSWVNDENRKHIVEFIRRKLKVGGVVYVSYNTQPGWSPIVPLRDLLTEHLSTLTPRGDGISRRIDASMAFASKLMAAQPAYAAVNPQVAEHFKRIENKSRDYLAHEYFNLDWVPMSFSKVAQWLTPAKLDFACSAKMLDHFEMLNLSEEQQALIDAIPDRMFRETVKNFCTNQQFRMDYWVKGARTISASERLAGLAQTRVVLTKPRSEVTLRTRGMQREVALQEDICNPMLDLLADHKPRSMRELAEVAGGVNMLPAVTQSIAMLYACGHLHPANTQETIEQVQSRTSRLNKHLIDKSLSSGEVNFLASPVTGGGVAVNRAEQLFLLARSEGQGQPDDWGSYAWKTLSSEGVALVKDGQTLTTADENLQYLQETARAFSDGRLAQLQALQVI